ncbi:MAG: hypothetical protein Ta2G_12620 [Termitinemataceae bacterium]|nr:MAG: hypothetical protein Ta2G_12620 [Termitinemataceae bacterium]
MKHQLYILMLICPIFCFTSCASLLYRSDVNYETSIMKPDGSAIWASIISFDNSASRASREADSIARREATYQKVVQHVEWLFYGWNFNFNQNSLAQGLQSGEYKRGDSINNVGYRSSSKSYGVAQGGGVYETGVAGGKYLIDPSKPESYYPIYEKTIKEQTESALDETKYKRVYEQNYNQLYTRYNKEFIERRDHGISNIKKKLKNKFIDIPDDIVFNTRTGKKLKGKDFKKIFQKQLNELELGTVLVNGGAYDDDILIIASIKNGVFECKMEKE